MLYRKLEKSNKARKITGPHPTGEKIGRTYNCKTGIKKKKIFSLCAGYDFDKYHRLFIKFFV